VLDIQTSVLHLERSFHIAAFVDDSEHVFDKDFLADDATADFLHDQQWS